MSAVPDSQEFDHATILLGHVCAARFDTRVPAAEFVRMVVRLVDVAVSRAVESVEALPHFRVTAADRVPTGIVDALKAGKRLSSTGAADAGSRADHQDGRAASEAPAAPSTTPLDSSRREAEGEA